MLEKTTASKSETLAVKPIQSGLERIAFLVLLITSFLLPIFLIPSPIFSIELTKSLLLFLGTIIALILWAVARLREGFFSFQSMWLVPMGILLALVSLVASIFSTSFPSSFINGGASIDTFAVVALSVVLMLLIPQLIATKRQILLFFGAFFTSLSILGLFQVVRLILGVDFLSMGVLNSSISNVLGKWNDLGIFFGLGALLSFLSIEMLTLSRFSKALLYVSIAVSLFFIIIINFTPLWVTFGILSFVLLVYILSHGGREQGVEVGSVDANRKISGIAMFFIALSIASIISGSSISDIASKIFDVGQIEARPSWVATLDLAKESIKESPLLGVGPNRFFEKWLLHKPTRINETAFWSTDFNFGIGYIPTTLVTSGVLGALSWLLFIALFLWLGIKLLVTPVDDTVNRFLLIGSYFGALYLWVFVFIYIPNIVIFSFAFLFTGLFIASASKTGIVNTYTLNFIKNPRLNFPFILAFVVLVIVSATAGYFVMQRYVASAFVGRGLQQLATTGAIDAGEANIKKGIVLNGSSDRFLRTLSDVRIAKLNTLLQNSDLSEEKAWGEFQRVLFDAIQSAESAVRLDPNNYANWVVLGRVYEVIVPLQIDTTAYENAREAYEQALVRNPHAPQIYFILARLEVARKNNDEARNRLADALNEKSNYTEAIFLLSRIEADEGNVSQAIRIIETASVNLQNDPEVFFQLGLLRYSDNQFTGAISALERAVELDPSYLNARYFLGLSYDQVWENERAIEAFEAILLSSPGNEEIKLILDNLKNGLAPFTDSESSLDEDLEFIEEFSIEEQ